MVEKLLFKVLYGTMKVQYLLMNDEEKAELKKREEAIRGIEKKYS